MEDYSHNYRTVTIALNTTSRRGRSWEKSGRLPLVGNLEISLTDRVTSSNPFPSLFLLFPEALAAQGSAVQ